MRDEIELLIKLQELDSTIARLRTTREDLTRQSTQSDERIKATQEQLESRTDESKSFQGALDAREVDLKATEEKIARLETQLNTVKTNKEYSALQHEIAGNKADKSKIEDDILQMIEQADKDKNDLKELAKAAEDAVQAGQERKKALALAMEDAEARMERLNVERKELAAGVPGKFLVPYERMAKKGHGQAMSACRNFVCESCRMSLTANTVNLLMAGEKLIFCHSCGRILYLARDEDVHGGIGAGRKDF